MSRAPVFLLGMMGAGKSRVGRELARLREAPFIDLDVRIERLFGAAIPRLFEDGEAYFRACERTALRSLLAEPGFGGSRAVVATGGGVVTTPENLDDMSAIGRTVFLDASIETLVARLGPGQERAQRPLVQDSPPAQLAQRLSELLAARAEAYARAELTVDASLAPEVLAAQLVERV